MLNISKHNVSKYIVRDNYSILARVERKKSSRVLKKIMYTGFILILIILFLPWTQNIRSSGNISALKPNQKPQSINSIIAGQIQEWYVQEGDFVERGDTLLKITEIKDDYFDENLLIRTKNQVNLKKDAIETYGNKINAQEEQLKILKTQRDLKLNQARIKRQQAELKVQNDSISLAAAMVNLSTAQYQYNRLDSLFQEGLKSLTDLEKRNIKLQETKAYELEARNKWLNSKNELISLGIEISNVKMKYEADYNKIQSEKFSTLSLQIDAESSLNKLQNQYSNYEFRSGLYFITAPQGGYITRTMSTGLGETIKEGEEILTIMPQQYDLAVETYIKPIDLPLMEIGQEVRIQFDGWPAIVFSGWPNTSYGTYGGTIYAVDQYLSENGKYRVLVGPDPNDVEWPDALRYGSGTSNMILLKEVPIWYELWRNINGFPPDFYKQNVTTSKEKKK